MKTRKGTRKTRITCIIIALAMLLSAAVLAACGKAEEKPVETPADSPSRTPTPSSAAPTGKPSGGSSAPILDLYYLNDKLMIEMLVNDDVIIEDIQNGIYLGTENETAAMLITFRPGLQNLGAAGEIARTAVSQAFSDAVVEALEDGSMFGARAKYCMFEAVSSEGNAVVGMTAAAIVNQSYYNVLVLFEEGAPEYDMQLMISVFGTINILQPTSVDQDTKQAEYSSQYQQVLAANKVQPARASSSKPVSQWDDLPYSFYSWWGDPGDYGSYPDWFFEPDWDYYSDPGDYWDWGWDDDGDWWFYDEYSDYYDYDYYGEYDDYWDDYDPWSDPGDYWDDYDPWSDPGDYYDDDYDDWDD